MIKGQQVNSPEGPGEVLTIFEDKVIIRLTDGRTTTLPVDQLEVADNNVADQTDLTQEPPVVAEARAQHASQILARLDHEDEQSEPNPDYPENQIQSPMQVSENALDVVNDLIEINNDRIEGFEKAITELEGEDNGFATLFNKLAEDSREHVAELTEVVLRSGYEPAEGTSTSGALHRAWLDIKAVFTGGDLQAVLDECERGEDAIKAAYQTALNGDIELGYELGALLRNQQETINEGHDLIRSLRDQTEAIEEDNDDYDPDDFTGDANSEETITTEALYAGAAEEPQSENRYIPEPEEIEQQQAWQDRTVTATSDSKLMEFFVDQLKDLLWAERELIDALQNMAAAATSPQLKAAFTNHMTETAGHISRLEQIFAILGLEPEAVKCDAMAGIVEEGENIIGDTDEATAQRDVGLIFAGQKAEHYEIATYGGMISLAKTLGFYEIAELLVLTIEEEKIADALLTEIAENHINYEASTEPADE